MSGRIGVHSAALLVALSAPLATGCAQTVDYAVIHPAAANFPQYGTTVRIGTIRANGHEDAADEIGIGLHRQIEGAAKEESAHGVKTGLHLVPKDGALIIVGKIDSEVRSDTSETLPYACTQTVVDRTWT